MAWSAPSVGPVGMQFGQNSSEVKSPASEATQPGSVTRTLCGLHICVLRHGDNTGIEVLGKLG